MKTLFVLMFGSVCAVAQPVGFGVKAGVPLTDFVDAAKSGNFGYVKHTNRYIFGLQGEARLGWGLGVEVDALYRHVKYDGSVPSATFTSTASSWEFPLLVKYRFPGKVLRPFVDAGVAWDTLHGLKQSILSGNPLTYNPASELHNKTIRGFVAGAGLDVKLLMIHIQPEIRYTRWGAKHFFDTSGLLNSNQTQAEFLVGITF